MTSVLQMILIWLLLLVTYGHSFLLVPSSSSAYRLSSPTHNTFQLFSSVLNIPSKEKAAIPHINRLQSLLRWDKLRRHIASAADKNELMVALQDFYDLSQSLLHSGVPEQVPLLYVQALGKIAQLPPHLLAVGEGGSEVNQSSSNSWSSKVKAWECKMSVLVTRAFLSVGQVEAALSQLQSGARRGGLLFDWESKCNLISDLAQSSPLGLKAAVKLRLSMLDRGEKVNGKAAAGILRGLWKHGLNNIDKSIIQPAESELEPDSPILSAAEDFFFDPTPTKQASRIDARELCRELCVLHLDAHQRKSHAVSVEAIRVVYRLTEDKEKGGDGFLTGLNAAIDLMKKHRVSFDGKIADCLLEEATRVNDAAAFILVTYLMQEKGLEPKSSTFVSLLGRHAIDGDGSTAVKLVMETLPRHNLLPSTKAMELALEACITPTNSMRSRRKGLELLQSISRNNNTITKTLFDQALVLDVLLNHDPFPRLKAVMSGDHSNIQPDEKTVMGMLTALTQQRDYNLSSISVLKSSTLAYNLLDRMILGEHLRRQIAAHTLTMTKEEMEERWELLLPPPNDRLALAAIETMSIVSSSNNSSTETGSPGVGLRVLKLFKLYLELCPKLGQVISFHDDEDKEVDDQDQTALQKIGGSDILPTVDLFATVIDLLVQDTIDDPTLMDKVRLSEVLLLVQRMEQEFHLIPNRRIYTALITAFGQRSDLGSALGVFQELRERLGAPDVDSLQALLDVCALNPSDLRQACDLLEEMSNDPAVDLTLFSGDLLMESFDDSLALGRALTIMEKQVVPDDCFKVRASLTVLGVLAQTVRTAPGQEALVEALRFLGKAGIRADRESMDYFCFDQPERDSPYSKYNTALVPRKEKMSCFFDSLGNEHCIWDPVAMPVRRLRRKNMLLRAPTSIEMTVKSTTGDRWMRERYLLLSLLPSTTSASNSTSSSYSNRDSNRMSPVTKAMKDLLMGLTTREQRQVLRLLSEPFLSLVSSTSPAAENASTANNMSSTPSVIEQWKEQLEIKMTSEKISRKQEVKAEQLQRQQQDIANKAAIEKDLQRIRAADKRQLKADRIEQEEKDLRKSKAAGKFVQKFDNQKKKPSSPKSASTSKSSSISDISIRFPSSGKSWVSNKERLLASTSSAAMSGFDATN